MSTLLARLDAYEKLVRLDKPIGILLLLWPTLWALWIASFGKPPLGVLWIFVLGTVVMRSAGCAMNDFADRRFDAEVERTRARPLAAGLIRPWEALAIAVAYPFTKRFFWMPQAFLGLAFGFGIPMAYAAVQGQVPPVAWALLAANVFWTIAYDTEYAMVDREDDRRIGLRTAAILFGRFDVAAVMACYAAFIAAMAAIGAWQRYGIPYYAGLVVAACLAAYHYVLIRGRTREGCFKAFLHNNWVGAAVFAGIVLDHGARRGWF